MPSVASSTPASPPADPSARPATGTSPATSPLDRTWHHHLLRWVRLTDLAVLIAAALLSHLVRFGVDLGARSPGGHLYAGISLLLIIVWWTALGVADSRSIRLLGSGSQEYRAVVNASLLVYVLVTTLSYLLLLQLARGYVLMLFPLGAVMLVLARRMIRQRLARARSQGHGLRRTMLVGSAAAIDVVGEAMLRTPAAGYRPVALVLPDGSAPRDQQLPSLRGRQDVASIVEMARSTDSEAVALAGADPLPSETLKDLTWALHEAGITLVMAPSLLGISSPHMVHQPLAGMPLIQIPAPESDGWRVASKRLFDIAVAALGLIVIAPVLLLLAVVIRLDSQGPALFRQERVGRDGRSFQILKLRTMVVDAEDRLAELLIREQYEAGGLFKMEQDPRITRVGAFLRRTSLDELPQLVNVLRGDMSLVGPRPPLPREVARYDARARGRLLVRPGLTGLWQVSGRSTLSWEDSVRLDLMYVEQWSMVQDLLILVKTVRAVASGRGAY